MNSMASSHLYLDINDESLFNQNRTKAVNGQKEGEVEKKDDGRWRKRHGLLTLAALATIGLLLSSAYAEDKK